MVCLFAKKILDKKRKTFNIYSLISHWNTVIKTKYPTHDTTKQETTINDSKITNIVSLRVCTYTDG